MGEHTLGLQFKRDAKGNTDVRVLHNQGRVRIARMAPPDDLDESVFGRIGQILGALRPFKARKKAGPDNVRPRPF